ncbi:BPL-N domain-containing protein [Amycolatopsis benzoatilytica]|uniref:BPL-N domain-containing protein n=1 Tax=Amycolatopsis benzoatilytica TaxID=346045 RepID=UPI00036688F3|nr:BPL-N domain-containing protein [Amycolatopsis benzoatilytica]
MILLPGQHGGDEPAPGANPGSRRALVDRRRLLFGLLPAAALLAACTPPDNPAPARPQARTTGKPLALIYNGPQGCTDCAPTMAEVLHTAPQPFEVAYVGPGTGTPLTASALAPAQLYVQPGGGADLDATWRDLKGSAKALRDWVHGGGCYLGLCFGGYLAGRNPGFELLPGDTRGYTDTPDATVLDARDTVVPVTWKGKPRHMYFQDGPAFLLDDGADATVLATYPNGTAAAVVAPYGKGRAGVCGPHPEADESWYADEDLTNPDGVRLDLAYELIDATLGRTAR